MVHRTHIEKIPARRQDSHKGDFGRVLVVAGSPGMTGAACLASLGALRAGSGLVTAAAARSLNPVMEAKLTEVMTLPLPETKDGLISKKAAREIIAFSAKCNAVAIGPGLGRKAETQGLVRELLKKIKCPVVLDADGLYALGSDTGLLKRRKAATVITPHPGEMARLIGRDAGHVQSKREETAKTVSAKTGAVVCLKGHRTVVAAPDGEVYVNETGNSGMASGGTGDVLTGMIASFIGQGLPPYSAAVTAVYLHGLAGDLGAEKKGPFSLIASDLIDFLPEAFRRAGIC